jgi:hypothetical protein
LDAWLQPLLLSNLLVVRSKLVLLRALQLLVEDLL